MSTTTENGVYFLLVGAALLLVAGVAALLRNTHGLPLRSRVAAMRAKAWAGFGSALPSRRSVCLLAVFVFGWIGGSLICGSICYGLLRWHASRIDFGTEAHEGAGDAMLIVFYAQIGLMFSLVVGLVVGLGVASWLSERLNRPGEKPTG